MHLITGCICTVPRYDSATPELDLWLPAHWTANILVSASSLDLLVDAVASTA